MELEGRYREHVQKMAAIPSQSLEIFSSGYLEELILLSASVPVEMDYLLLFQATEHSRPTFQRFCFA
jgi:hypothetical protein